MMDLMCPLWMMFSASGLSIKIQCKTSRMPERTREICTYHGVIDTRREEMLLNVNEDIE